MDIVFDRGSAERPKGHALLYFRNSSDPDEVWVTYMVILPISVDVSKYVPPFLMDQVAQMGPKELSAFAFPPAPERLGSYQALQELAAKRDDDILSAGTVNPTDVPSAMMSINEAVRWYAEIYSEVVGIAGAAAEEEADDDDSGLGVTEVLYSLMSDADKLGELTKLVGRLKFAVDGADAAQIDEAEAEVGLLSKHLPDNNNVAELIEAVKSSDRLGTELADLYLRRCYHLVHEEYGKLGHLDEEIKALESRPSPD